MKRKVTEARKANRYFPKSAPGGIYCMSVAERRRQRIFAPDSAEYDRKHGVVMGGATKRIGFIKRIFKSKKGE